MTGHSDERPPLPRRGRREAARHRVLGGVGRRTPRSGRCRGADRGRGPGGACPTIDGSCSRNRHRPLARPSGARGRPLRGRRGRGPRQTRRGAARARRAVLRRSPARRGRAGHRQDAAREGDRRPRSAAGSGRVQCTPDLLPADVTGTTVYGPATGAWEFRPGPVFANVVLVDEVNRASPRTQAALLEPMEERQVTVDGVTHGLPEPFFVVATQNPAGAAGTFPLPESQLDRFAIVCTIGLPARDAEREILSGRGGADALDAIQPVTTPDVLADAIASGAARALRGVGDRLRARCRGGDARAPRRADRRVTTREPRAAARRAGARDGRRSRLRVARRREGGRAASRSRTASCCRTGSTPRPRCASCRDIVAAVAPRARNRAAAYPPAPTGHARWGRSCSDHEHQCPNSALLR